MTGAGHVRKQEPEKIRARKYTVALQTHRYARQVLHTPTDRQSAPNLYPRQINEAELRRLGVRSDWGQQKIRRLHIAMRNIAVMHLADEGAELLKEPAR